MPKTKVKNVVDKKKKTKRVENIPLTIFANEHLPFPGRFLLKVWVDYEFVRLSRLLWMFRTTVEASKQQITAKIHIKTHSKWGGRQIKEADLIYVQFQIAENVTLLRDVELIHCVFKCAKWNRRFSEKL
jgi:hypothetical protein